MSYSEAVLSEDDSLRWEGSAKQVRYKTGVKWWGSDGWWKWWLDEERWFDIMYKRRWVRRRKTGMKMTELIEELIPVRRWSVPYWPAYIVYRGQTSDALWRLSSSVVVCNTTAGQQSFVPLGWHLIRYEDDVDWKGENDEEWGGSWTQVWRLNGKPLNGKPLNLRVHFLRLAASSVKHNVMVWRPSVRLFVCPVSILTVTRQGQHATRPTYISARHMCIFVSICSACRRVWWCGVLKL